MATKKLLLPKNFDELLEKGDLDVLKAVFDTCEVDARGGYSKETAIAFDLCPDALVRWLVLEKGADLQAPDQRGATPLHARVGSRRSSIDVLLELGAKVNDASAPIGTPLHAAAQAHNSKNLRKLLAHGADVHVVNSARNTPLQQALETCSNIDIVEMVAIAEALLAAGAEKDERAEERVTAIGERFEFHRQGFNAEYLEEYSSALDRLYGLFGVPPVPRRIEYDGRSPIVLPPGDWPQQHEALWQLLVPSKGAAATAQGEAIRISGRLANEWMGNGGINWDADFKKMAKALVELLGSGSPLAQADLAEAQAIVADISEREDDVQRLSQLAVTWVGQNSAPIKQGKPAYKR